MILGLGEVLWDVFPDGKKPGGAPANVAFHANQLGCHGMIGTAIGDDEDGNVLLSTLAERVLDVSLIQRDSRHPTGRVTVTLSPEGQPSYQIHEPVAWDFIQLADNLREAVASASAICFGTLAQRNAVSRATIQQVLNQASSKCLKVYDINLRQSFYERAWIDESLHKANVIKLNDEEVRILSPILGLPAAEEEFGREVARHYSAEMVCITRGSRGCLVVTSGESYDIPGRAVKIADTVGAGDAFTAGLIVARLRGWPIPLAAEFANRVGGLVASRQGAMPDLREELAQLLDQYSP